VLVEEQIETFHKDGFLALPALVGDETVRVLRMAYDELLEQQITTDRNLGGITRQIMVPSAAHPVFDDNEALRRAKKIVSQLFGTSTAARTYDMLIYKPPGHPHETPWHQDAGYFGRPVASPGTAITFRSVQFWVALDDADVENGCMHFVPMRDRSVVLEHHVVSGDPASEGRLIGMPDPANQLDLSTVVPCEIPAGGCTLHTAGTPHYTPPNRSSNRPRRAYIFNLDPGDHEVHPIEQQLRESYVTEITKSRRNHAG
jgi:ectoine hydroxylase-related dioxygenase (phytanoyl-CoA dioxygenase family)